MKENLSTGVRQVWTSNLLDWGVSVVLPVMLGLILGPLIAFLINAGFWTAALALVVAVPVVAVFTGYPFFGVMIWVLIQPFVAHSPNYASRYIYWMVHRGLLPVSFVAVFFFNWVNRRKVRPPTFGPAEVSMFVYLLYTAVSIFIRSTGGVSGKLIRLYDTVFAPYALYLTLRLSMPRSRDMKRLVPILAIVCIAESLIGLTAWFAPDVLPSVWTTKQGFRTTGTFKDPAEFTTTLTFTIFIILHYVATRKSGGGQYFLTCVCALGIGCILFAFSRTSWFGIAVASICLLILYPRSMLRVLIVLAIVTILLGASLAPYLDFAISRLEEEASRDARSVATRLSLRMIAAKPIFGWGYGDYRLYDWQFITSEDRAVVGSFRVSSHDTYLTIAAEQGIVGLMLYIFPVFWWLNASRKIIRRWQYLDDFWDRRLLLVLWLIALFNILVTSFINMLFFPFGLSILWLALGLIASMLDDQTQLVRTADALAETNLSFGLAQ